MITCKWLDNDRCGLADQIAAQHTETPAHATCEQACLVCQSRHSQTPTVDAPGTVVASLATHCGHTAVAEAMRPHLLTFTAPKLVQRNAKPRQQRIGPESLPCIHRGDVIRQDTSNICGSVGTQINVFGCALHAECTIGRYCKVQIVRTCIACDDRVEPPPN